MEGDGTERRSARRLALLGFCLGFAGLLTTVFAFGVLIAFAGIVCSGWVILQRRPWQPNDGHGFALAGLMLGIASILSFPLFLATVIPRVVARHDAEEQRICRENVYAIAAAKMRWANEHHASEGAIVRTNDLFNANYFPAGAPRCPAGGSYRINPIGRPPACSENAHR